MVFEQDASDFETLESQDQAGPRKCGLPVIEWIYVGIAGPVAET
jgi:hypothetical protein